MVTISWPEWRQSWARAVLFGFPLSVSLLVLGGLQILSNSGFSPAYANSIRLLTHGATCDARITYLDHQPYRQHRLAYIFEVGGHAHTGLTNFDVDAQTFDRMAVGGRIRVLYLADDPSISAYDPGAWIAQRKNWVAKGWWCAGAGAVLAVLFVIGILIGRKFCDEPTGGMDDHR